jgi:pimeloyl-ACP methyl ester carboxylesterase
MESLEVRYNKANGITMAYHESSASGYPLVLINGFASTMDMWNPPLLALLARTFRVIVFDNRGSGYSSASDEPFSIPLFAEDTLALLDALGISRAHILGVSMGASVAQELVLTQPGRVDRLVLLSGTCGGRQGVRMQPEIWTRLTDKSGSTEEIAVRMFSLLFPADWLQSHDPWKYCPVVREITSPENAARQADCFFAWPGSYNRLPGIRCLALVVTGTGDVVIPPENSRILAGRIAGARLAEIPDAGHGLQYQCPGKLATTVVDFLNST